MFLVLGLFGIYCSLKLLFGTSDFLNKTPVVFPSLKKSLQFVTLFLGGLF